MVILYPVRNAEAMGRKTDVSASGEEAVETGISNPASVFNRGVSEYEHKDFKAAAEDFQKALGMTSDPKLQARSAYNAGNAFFRQSQFDEAVEKYKQALRLNPADPDAKHNLEFAQRVQKVAQKNQSNKDSDKNKKDQDQEQKSGAGQKQDDKKNGKQQDQQQKSEEQKAEEQKAQGAPKKGQMSKEDAERLLQAIQQQELDARKKAPKPEFQDKKVEQDW